MPKKDDDDPPQSPPPGPKTYTIDVRVFLAAVTTTMALAFGTGVALGPSHPPLPLTKESIVTTPGVISSSEREDLLNEVHVNLVKPSLEDLGSGSVQYDPNARSNDGPQGSSNANQQREYEPAGQHLLVDIANVEAAFLNSEERLADAMVRSVEGAGLTMLSYHCHALQPAGVSCVGVLMESHISFHTWPDEGVITLDLFTCGPKPLLPVIPTLERLFGVPRVDEETGEVGKAKVQWSHELRGFRNEGPNLDSATLDSKSDLSYWIMSVLQYYKKEEVMSKTTKYQRVDIWDYLDVEDTPSHEDAIRHNLTAGDPRWLTPEVATPDRYVFLNGDVMNTKDTSQELYESLVHPAMFTHSNPKNIVVLGGGHGASIREILKHNTVESATIIEIDEDIITIAREHLTYFTDCSDWKPDTPDCYDDERVKTIHGPIPDYFASIATEDEAPKFDVVVVDLHNFHSKLSPTTDLYTDRTMFNNILESMSDDGVMVIRNGGAPTIHAPRASIGLESKREEMMVMLEEHPLVEAMLVYEEAHAGFNTPLAFLVVCKKATCRRRWYAASDERDTDIYSRIHDPIEEGTSLLLHYDGSTQENFQHLPIAWETVYCRRDPEPFECDYRGLDTDFYSYEYDAESQENSSFRIETQEVDGEEITKVFALEDISKGSYIMPYDLAVSFSATKDVLDNLQANTEITATGRMSVIEDFLQFVDQHGHRSSQEGRELTHVEIGASFMIRRSENENEVNIAKWMPNHPGGKKPTYSPVYERHMVSFDVFLVASKDIKKGDEVVKPVDLWTK